MPRSLFSEADFVVQFLPTVYADSTQKVVRIPFFDLGSMIPPIGVAFSGPFSGKAFNQIFANVILVALGPLGPNRK